MKSTGSGAIVPVSRTLRMRPVPPADGHRPAVSVVITCFNYAHVVREAIGSALRQSGVDVEVIVVDDRSSDDSVEVARRAARDDSRVTVIAKTRNGGAVAAFNEGLSNARGDYVVRLDADDLLTPGALERAVALGSAAPSVGLIYGHPLHFSDALPPARGTAARWTIWPGLTWLRARCRTGVNVITSPEVVMRRSVLDTTGGMRELAHTHDMELWLRIASVADVAYIEGADQAWHREHPSSLSQSIRDEAEEIRGRWDAFRTLFGWTATRLPETPGLESLARRALADEALRRVMHLHDRSRPDPALESELLGFAGELGAVDLVPRQWQAAHRAQRRRRIMPWHTARATMRGVRNRLEFRRWHRHGVFHRDAPGE